MKVHAGCKNCYAETLDNRYHNETPHWGPNTSRMAIKSAWNNLKKYQQAAAKLDTQHFVFVGSMMDIFEDPLPVVNDKNEPILEYKGFNTATAGPGVLLSGIDSRQITTGNLRDNLFKAISEGQFPNLIFLLLTKRPENINKYIPEAWLSGAPSNVVFGTSVVDQETADKYVPELLKVAGRRFLSCEPLLGAMNLRDYIYLTDANDSSNEERFEKMGWGYDNWSGGFVGPGSGDHCYDPKSGIDWVICGGESGSNARPIHPDWARDLRDQCEAAEIPFFFKQWGEWHPFYDRDVQDPDWQNIPKESNGVKRINLAGGHGFHGERVVYFERIGKKDAGAILDFKEHKNFISCE